MSFVTRITLAAVFAAAVAGTAAAKDWSTIRVGSDATYPPFESADAGGNIVGFDIDILNAICDELKVKCVYQNQSFDGIIEALNAGKYDVIDSSLSITPDRQKLIDFSDKVYNTPPAIVVNKDSDIKGVTVDDLAGKTIGVQTNTTHATFAEKTFTKSEIKIYPSSQEAELDLASGRIDAINDDVVVLDDWLSKDGKDCCKVAGTLKPDPAIHGPGAAFGVRKEDTDLRDLLNKGLAAIRANGKYKEINDKYFTFDAYGD